MQKFNCFLIIFLSFLTGCSPKTTQKGKEREIRVTTGHLVQRTVRRVIPIQGTVWPIEYAMISAKNQGTLEKLYVKKGDFRKKGEILFEIDRQILKNYVAITENGIAVKQAAQQAAEIRLETEKIKYNLAKQNFDRSSKLYKNKVISQANYEEDETAFQKAVQDIHSAEASVALARAELLQQESNLKIAQKNLTDSAIPAPFDCVITQKCAHENEFMKVGTNIIYLENPNSQEIICKISAVYYHQIIPGKTEAEIIGTDGNLRGKAIVTFRSPTIDAESRTFELKIRIAKEMQLVNGMLCSVNILLESRTAWVLPTNALLLRAGNRYICYTVGENGRAQSVEVKKGLTDGAFTEILQAEPLLKHTFIVTGQTFVNNGSLLKIMDQKQ